MEIRKVALAKLTLGKAVTNTALRWLPLFLPTLAIAFDASTAMLALMLGLAEAAGLATFFAGRWLDAGHERRVIMLALVGVALSSLLALSGSLWGFAAAVLVLGASSGHVPVGGHAWISARVSFDRRARFIGVYEISWASAMLIGAPLVALLIDVFGWRGPFVAVAIAAVGAAVLIATIDDGPPRPVVNSRGQGPQPKITADAWLIIGVSATVAMAGLTTVVVAGTWLDDVLGVSTSGIGLVAMAFGTAELIASSMSSAFADRLGKRATMQVSVTTLLAGIGVIALAGTSLLVGAIGLCVFFLGFEYSIVTGFSLLSEAMPASRGRAIGVGSAVATAARGVGVAAAGFLYEQWGIDGPLVVSTAAAISALLLLRAVGRRRPDIA